MKDMPKIKTLNLSGTEFKFVDESKVALPEESPNGMSGQLLRTNGDGTTAWVDEGLPTDEQTADAVSDWLDEHPEATTTVQDGAISYAKLNGSLQENVDSIASLKEMIATTEASSTASVAHAKGSYFIYNGVLYQATVDIASGDNIVTSETGQNCVAATVGEEIDDLNSAIGIVPSGKNVVGLINEEFTARILADSDLQLKKVNIPRDLHNQPTNGTAGQVLRTNGDGSTEWAYVGLPTDEQTQEAITEWLEDHPEATTTVQDGSLTLHKFKIGELPFVTPEMFGAKGDGETDDKQALQDCFDFASENDVIIEMLNKTYICYELTLHSGTVLHGNGATLKKPVLSSAPYNMSVSNMKWIRMVNVHHSGSGDSKLTVISDLNVDSNCWTMWQISDGYAQEQASSFICSGDNINGGRLRIAFSNCSFRDCPSDGIHITHDVEAYISNCKSTDCFRGGLVITSGNTDVTVDGFEFNSPNVNDGIDIEVDSSGYNSSRIIDVSMTNIIMDKDLDIIVPYNSRVIIDNLVMRDAGYFLASSGYLHIKNSLLKKSSSYSGGAYNYLNMRAYDMVFENVIFDGNEKNSAAQMIYTSASTNPSEPLRIVFKGCTFRNATYGIGGPRKTSTSDESDYSMLVDGCVFDTTNGIGAKEGNVDFVIKRLTVKNCIFNNCSTAIVAITTSSYPMTVIFEDNTLKNVTRCLNAGTIKAIINGLYESGITIDVATGTTPKFFGKRLTIVDEMPEVRGMIGTIAEDYATDGVTLWKYAGSGTVWNVVN